MPRHSILAGAGLCCYNILALTIQSESSDLPALRDDSAMGLFWRLSILVFLMVAIAAIDYWRHASNATKWREYLFLAVAALIGGLVGLVVTHVSASLSPDYFIIGKGIPPGDRFHFRAVHFGFDAGMLVGVVIGGAYLLTNHTNPNRKSLSFLELMRFTVQPLVCIVVIMPTTALVMRLCDPFGLAADPGGFLNPTELKWFLTSWGLNLGVYLGSIVGAIWGIVRIRQARAFNSVGPQAE